VAHYERAVFLLQRSLLSAAHKRLGYQGAVSQDNTCNPWPLSEDVRPAFWTKAAGHSRWKIISRKGLHRPFNDPTSVFWHQHEVLRTTACDVLAGSAVAKRLEDGALCEVIAARTAIAPSFFDQT
jgi:hypothetical protein